VSSVSHVTRGRSVCLVAVAASVSLTSCSIERPRPGDVPTSPALVVRSKSIALANTCGERLFDVGSHGETLVVDPDDQDQIDSLKDNCERTRVASRDWLQRQEPCEKSFAHSVLISARTRDDVRTSEGKLPTAFDVEWRQALTTLQRFRGVSVAVVSPGTIALDTSEGLDPGVLKYAVLLSEHLQQKFARQFMISLDMNGPPLTVQTEASVCYNPRHQEDNSQLIDAIGGKHRYDWQALPVTVAVVDVGGAYQHRSFAGNLECCTGTPDLPCGVWASALPGKKSGVECVGSDNHYHATAMAGLIGDANKMFGLAYRANVQSWRPRARSTEESCLRPVAIANEITAAAQSGARVMNLSVAEYKEIPPIIENAIINARHANSDPVIVISAGNRFVDIDKPGNEVWPGGIQCSGVVTVSATDIERKKMRGSWGDKVPLVVPLGDGCPVEEDQGVCMLASPDQSTEGCPDGPDGPGSPDGYFRVGKTSAAAAAVSAAAAMVLSHPDYTHYSAAQVVDILRDNARKTPPAIAIKLGKPGGFLDVSFLNSGHSPANQPADNKTTGDLCDIQLPGAPQ
jgi:subtilase family protein